MELAARMNAKLFFFTAVPSEKNEAGLRHVYHSLLAARGSYLQHANPLERKPTVKTERCIERGDFTWSLLKFVRRKKFDVIVVDPKASVLSPDTLQDVVAHSNGVIVLPEQTTGLDEPAHEATEQFYDILRNSETYKLPGNFFSTLGKDKSLFNYLRKIFSGGPAQN